MAQKHSECLICKGTELEVMKRYDRVGLVKCKKCKFVFCDRIPTLEELITNYNGYARADRISPITVKRYNELLDQFEPYRLTNNIIDVGCGDGHFLKVAKERGWNVYGTEFTDRAMELCLEKGIKMQKGVLNPGQYPVGSFDVITSFEVIEHINNPVQEVKNFKQLLRKGGILYVTTPNFNSISRYILKEKYNIIEYPEHLCYYTKSTLCSLMAKNDFDNLSFKTTGFSINRFKKSSEGGQSAPVVNRDESLRNAMEYNKVMQLMKWMINFGLDVFKMGDSSKAFFRNK